MALVELVVLLGAIALISTTGMKLIHFALRRMSDLAMEQREQLALQDIRNHMQRAWDQRLAPWGGDIPWLEISATGSNGSYELLGIGIRTASDDVRSYLFELVRSGEEWKLNHWPEGSQAGQVEKPLVFYRGRILVDQPAGIHYREGGPDSIHLRFPDAATADLRQGFAIHSYW